VEESESRFAVGWASDCRIEQEAFVVFDHATGRVRTIYGYPAAEIAKIIERM
jgi:hypothetical protein